jgi:putative ABC transport system permease protein
MNDIRYAVRTFSRTPAFTLVAVLTLALGIGATTVIFSVVNAVLLRPLPYADADRLVTTRGSLPDLRDLQRSSQAFDGMAFWASNLYNLKVGTDSRQVRAGQITRDLLPLLGVQPFLGRNFTAEDDRQDTVILGHALWRSRFAGDAGVIGKTIDLSGTTYTIIGVAPPWFRFPTAEFQLWAPLSSIDRNTPAQARNRAFRIFSAVALLKRGVALGQAQAEARSLSTQLAREFPATNEGVMFELEPLYDRIVGDSGATLGILFGTVVLLLLIACANVASLMLARATIREREIAIRIALGAGRGRLIRQLLAESLTLAVAGGLLAMLVTLWGIDLLPSILETRLPRADGIRIDGRVLAFSVCATMLTGLFFGMAPALQAAIVPGESLKETGRSVAGSVRGRRLRRGIVIVETALAVLVLVGAGLLVRSFMTLAGRDAGFVPDHLISFNVQFVALPDDAVRARTATALMEKLAGLPGMEAGAATGFPTVTPQRWTRFAIEGRTLTADEDGGFFIAATPGYFATLRTPVLEGRAIDRQDAAGGAPVVVINRRLERQLFPDGGAVGRRLKIINPEQSSDWRAIVGVVGDVNYRGPNEAVQPTVYTPFAQTPFPWLYVMVRSPEDVTGVTQTLRRVVPSVQASLTAANIRPMTDVMAQGVAEPRFNMLLISAFALLALLLSSVGIYGVIAYSVAQRTHEIGVRMALGASRRDVVHLVLAEGAGIAIAGVALGVGASLALTRVMSTLLVGVSPRDPVALTAGAALLLAVAIVASCLPAVRASRVEPMAALREE